MGRESDRHFSQEPSSPTSGEPNRSRQYPIPSDIPLGVKFIGEKLSAALRREEPTKRGPEIITGPQEEISLEPTLKGGVIEGEVIEGREKATVTTVQNMDRRLTGLLEGNPNQEDVYSQKINLSFWTGVLSPKTLFGQKRAEAQIAKAETEVVEARAGTYAWLGKMKRAALQREVLARQMDAIRDSLRPNVEKLCKKRGEDFPAINSPREAALYAEVNGSLAGAQETVVTIQGGMMDIEGQRAGIQLRTAKNEMYAREVPRLIESQKRVNVLRGEIAGEWARTKGDKGGRFLSGGVVGTVGGIFGGIAEAVRTSVRENALIAIPFGGITAVGTLAGAKLITLSNIPGIGTGIVLVGTSLAVGAGVGYGLWEAWTKSPVEQKEPSK